jgi:glycosyltransferase involved in cell wall biosynthesis
MDKVTIILPVYNASQFIERTLNSIIGEADKIIISDNASIDGTSDICQSYASKYMEIKYIRQEENIGGLANIIYLLNQVEGEYTRLVGGHDFISRGSTKTMLDLMESDASIGMVYSKYLLYMNPDYSIKDFHTYTKDFCNVLKSDSPFTRVGTFIKILEDTSIYHALYRTDIFKSSILEHRIFDNFFGEGLWMGNIWGGRRAVDDDTSIYFRIDNHKSFSNSTSAIISMLNNWVPKNYNPLIFFLGGCEMYDIVKTMQTWPFAPENFAKEMLEALLSRFRLPYEAAINMKLENLPPVCSGKQEVLDEFFKAMVKYNKRGSFHFLRKYIKKVHRFINRIYNFIGRVLRFRSVI